MGMWCVECGVCESWVSVDVSCQCCGGVWGEWLVVWWVVEWVVVGVWVVGWLVGGWVGGWLVVWLGGWVLAGGFVVGGLGWSVG